MGHAVCATVGVATEEVKMGLLVGVLRFIVGFLSFVIILASVAFGVFMVVVLERPVIAGFLVALGGRLASSVLFGVIALLFQIRDSLAALQKHAERDTMGITKPDNSERIEPSLRNASS